ncbi:MAG: transporter substrate-binding protein [Deltaproteobacteria bacterium]|jgi:TRAP-type C4-dicarboxylate transport system substrate-binding protein|nr:transporter substrate-binding protein [Deltaproteobacteria bacterium]
MKRIEILIFLVLITLLVPSIALGQTQLKFCNYFPVPAAQSKIGDAFIKDLEAQSKGQLKITYFPAGTLLTAPKMYDGIEQGIADIGLSNIGYTFGRFRVSEVLDLPLGFPNAWVANHVANDFIKKFKPKEWDNIHMISMHTSPVNVVLSATKPVYKLEDLKGMTLRGLGFIAGVVSALGATPRPIPTPEAYEAMQKNVIDGLMIPMETMRAFRYAEVAKHVTECWAIGQVYTFYLVMNKNVWNKLPADIQKIFNEYPFEEKFATMWNEIDIDGKKYGEEKGLQFIELQSEEISKWKKAVEPVLEDYVKKMVASGFNEKETRELIKYAQERIEYWTKKQKESGVKSSTGPAEVRVK